MYELEPFSTTQCSMMYPLRVQEMARAVWLIVKGVRPPMIASAPIREVAAITG